MPNDDNNLEGLRIDELSVEPSPSMTLKITRRGSSFAMDSRGNWTVDGRPATRQEATNLAAAIGCAKEVVADA